MAASIYIPERHAERDCEWAFDFIDEFPFAMLVTARRGVEITNVPVWLDRGGKIWFHLARANPQNAALGEGAVLMFRGPHGYISPGWYETKLAVPTWNFAAVHATGPVRAIEDDDAVEAGLRRLVEKFDRVWSLDRLPADYLRRMRQGIVAYAMTIEGLETKVKLGQERSEADRAGILAGLEAAPVERSLAELTRAYYERGRVNQSTAAAITAPATESTA